MTDRTGIGGSSHPAEDLRRQQHEAWTRAAAGWERRQRQMREATAPVSHWMVHAIRPQPGHAVLELAAGMGETGFLAAELIAPGGRLICSDAHEAMLDGARRRARELGLADVEFKELQAEWIDLPLATVDGVLCRWGYMLMADPDAALHETRRVLRPGGRMAMAAWTSAAENPWASVPVRELVARGHLPAPDPQQPGMFALGDPENLAGRLRDAGFSEVQVAPLDFSFAMDSLDQWWETQLDLSPWLGPTLEALGGEEAASVREAVYRAAGEHVGPGGGVVFSARTLVAAASA